MTKNTHDYIVTRDASKLQEFIQKGWELISSVVTAWGEPENGQVKATEMEYTLRLDMRESRMQDRIETKV